MHSSVFQALSSFLLAHRPLWQLAPFECQTIPWIEDYPELVQGLEQLTEGELAHLLQDEVDAHAWVSHFVPKLDELGHDWLVKPQVAAELPFWLLNGVKGRKCEQIAAFCAQLPSEPNKWLEWCAGKGHLGRVAHHQTSSQITSLEWQPELCQQGQKMADQLQSHQQFVHADVLKQDMTPYLKETQGVMALHACGQLHMQLLTLARQQRVHSILLCPCCYHLIEAPEYLGMSTQAKSLGLVLSKRDLKLPLQQLVTTGQRGRKLRDTELLWRLSFSQYVQLLTNNDHYTPLPNFAKSILSQDFAAFCRWGCQTKDFPFEPSLVEQALKLGYSQLNLVNKIELVRQRFRRHLEMWLVLDRVVFLEEAGYQVDVMAFCDFSVTPRNLLLKAQLIS